jgi:hypothetical protein
MKHSKLITAATLLIMAVTSCRKNDIIVSDPVQVTNGVKTLKLAKIETADGSYTENFTYGADGRMTKWSNSYFTIMYSYTATPFGYDVFAQNSQQKNYDISDVTMNNGRAERFLYRRIKSDGSVMWADTTTQQYDANGYQVQKLYWPYKYTSEITAGNTTKMTALNMSTGKVNYEVTAEYFTDRPNKMNINIFEYNQFDHILSDKEQFGKMNANLPKKITRISANKYVYDYNYEFDANGYITSYTISYAVNDGTPALTTYKLSYL